jgi:FtsH-binding integral membrane protein
MAFYIGVISIGRFVNGYILLTELVPERHQSIVGALLLTGDTMMILYLTFYYRYISRDAFYLNWIGLILLVVCTIVTMFLIPESPQWLISVKQYKRAKDSLY